MKPIKIQKIKTIIEYMLVCPKCYTKTIVGLTESTDVECTYVERVADNGQAVKCDYIFRKEDIK